MKTSSVPEADSDTHPAPLLAKEHLAQLTEGYWRYVPVDELEQRSPEQLQHAVQRHMEFASSRTPGQLLVRIDAADSPDTDNPRRGNVLEIVTDDTPFLVDSVTAELSRLRVPVNLFVHPQVVVERDPLGKLQRVLGGLDMEELHEGQLLESWMRIEIGRCESPENVAAIQQNVRRVLTDVREAVEDWGKMRSKALSIADEFAQAELPVPDKDVADARGLLQWLAEDHFTFLGYREYQLVRDESGESLRAVRGTGLGVLRGEPAKSRRIDQMAADVRERILEQRLLIITKANSRSTVHRPSYLDYIGLKVFGPDGSVVGERRFLGLFASAAYLESVRNLPVVSRKVDEVIERAGLNLRSHSGKELLQILETYPRDELFQIRTGELHDTVMSVLRLGGRRQLRLFVRKDAYGRFVSCLVYLPRDRYTTLSRNRMQEILAKALHGIGVDYTARVTEGVLARVRFVVRTDPNVSVSEVDTAELQTRLIEVTRLWEEDFAQALRSEVGGRGSGSSLELVNRYQYAFGPAYQAERNPAAAVADVARVETLDASNEIVVHIEPAPADRASEKGGETMRFTVYHRGEAMSLSAVLPVLQSLGFTVIDERPYQVSPAGSPDCWIYDFGLALSGGLDAEVIDDESIRVAVENAFIACWRNESEVDGFNQLVLWAGLTWDQVVILRAYTKYLRQAGSIYSETYLQNTLATHPQAARGLVELFAARFDPSYDDAPARIQEWTQRLLDNVEQVTSLDADRMLRGYLALIQATLRTNHYQRGEDGRRKLYLSLKLDPQQLADLLPKPRPKFEIFVYSPWVEGVHLRYGSVARGGLRWSDRREDFRTEVLGLVKAQMVKNTIIVPVGSKGGFVVKQTPIGGRSALVAEGVACYRTFISGLLDITDNIVAGKVVPPADVVRYDEDDPYLVVAADKGTATFSDIANSVAEDYHFWLGDAFASGGSEGYDHKKMGITARGAWESVKRHFRELVSGKDDQGRELGINTQEQDFTVIGIGDMSGDVFGNGMLCSEHIRLVAAFDHRHIFVDPNPDAATGFAERKRLFELPTSSWADYDTSLISRGGGVWPRTAKSVAVSSEMQAALGLPAGVKRISPPELISAILTAPADLLWNGGIGTYVKASTESHADVGDKANDAVRVNGADLRCKVVGEGGNLGLTQRARIEYAQAGGRINTDAIDNSAGVDTSDHEVNIKILLRQAMEDGELASQARTELLFAMTDEVAQLALANNYQQNNALALSTYLSPKLNSVHRRMMTEMERAGRLDRVLEFLPDDAEIAEREALGQGLVSPELAVLLAYVKIGLKYDVLASDLPDDPWCTELLVNYFPTPLRERFRSYMDDHRLRREIITTLVVNDAVNRGGISFVYRAMEETGASAVDVLRAYIVISEVLGLGEMWADNSALDNRAPIAAQLSVAGTLRRVLDRGVRWLLQSRGGSLNVATEVERLGPGIAGLMPYVCGLFVGQESKAVVGHIEQLTQLGAPADLAKRVVSALYGFGLFDVVELANRTGEGLREIAQLYYTASDRFRIDELMERVTQLPRADRWSTLARMAVRYDLYGVLAGITKDVATSTTRGADPSARVEEWSHANEVNIERVRNTLALLPAEGPADLATISVLLRQLRTIV